MKYTKDYVKNRTIEIYDSLPQNKELRKQCTQARDEIIELNYTFFGYVASHTFINNSSIDYEDKFQSALMHFCECWWWYKWEGDETHKGYRTDLSFSVFFKPRIGEMIERELNEVKYSVRRSLCMEVGAMIGKHWGQVKYEDLSDPRVQLPPNKMIALKAIFGSLYNADLEDFEMYFAAPQTSKESPFENPTTQYDSITELLIHDMIEESCKFNDDKLKKMSEIYGIPFYDLKKALPDAEKQLYDRLHSSLDNKIWIGS